MTTKTISVFKNNISLVDVINEIDTPNQKTGEPNNKLLVWVNNYANKESHKEKKGVGAYLDIEEAKLLFSDLADGTFANRIHNVKEKGKYTKIGGVAQARILNIVFENGMFEISVAIHKALKGNNGSTKPGEMIDRHSVKLNTFNMRKLAMTVRDYINQKQLVMMLGAGIPLVQREVAPAKEEESSDLPPVNEEDDSHFYYDDTNDFHDEDLPPLDGESYIDGMNISESELDAILGIPGESKEEEENHSEESHDKVENDPILPSGKYQGKRLSEMNDAYKNWIVENAKGDKWNEIKAAITGGQA